MVPDKNVNAYLHILWSFSPALASLHESHFQFPLGGRRAVVSRSKNKFLDNGRTPCKACKEWVCSANAGKVVIHEFVPKNEPVVVVAALIDIFRSLKVTICHFITMNLCLLREMRREKTGNSIYPLHWPDKTISTAWFMIWSFTQICTWSACPLACNSSRIKPTNWNSWLYL